MTEALAHDDIAIYKLTMKLLTKCILTMPLLMNVASSPAFSQPGVRCQELYNDCKLTAMALDDPKLTGLMVMKQGYCLGYLDGTSAEIGSTHSASDVCLEEGPRGPAIIHQLLPTFLSWVEHHPEALDEDENVCVAMALHEAFPCYPK